MSRVIRSYTASTIPFDNTILEGYGVTPATQTQEAVDSLALFTYTYLVAAFDELGLKANDAEVVHLAGTETITGAKTFEAATVIDGDAGTSTVGALKIEGTTDVRYFQITGPTAQPFTITDTRTSSANLGAGLAIGSNDGAAMESGHRLGYLLANAYDGAATRNAVAFSFYASDNWSSGYYPAHGTLEASNGTGARVELFRWGGTGTSGVTINEGGLDRDTRIEGDTDTNLFFADASTDRIGIGNNAPFVKLDVTGDVAVSGTVYGGTALTDSLELSANDETIDAKTNTGKINFKSMMKHDPTFTANWTFDGLFFNQVEFFAMNFSPTVTMQSGTTAGGGGVLRNMSTIKYSNSQILTSCPTFQSLATIQPTVSVNDNALSAWVTFQAMDNFSPDLSTAVNATTASMYGMIASPRASIKAGSHASATATVTNLVCYNAFYGLLGTAGSQATVTTATGYEVNNPVVTGTGAITNVIGIDVDALTIGGTSNIGLRMAKANTYTIQLSDTGGTAAGGITFGTDTNLYRSAANVLKTDDKLLVTGELELDGAFNHDGTTVGFYGTAPATQSTGWSATNVTTDKTFDANATTIDELADVVGTLIDTLKTMGVIGA